MSTFWIVLFTALLTILAQKFLNGLYDFIKNKAMESLADLCTLALGQQCFALRITKDQESYFVVQMSESKKVHYFYQRSHCADAEMIHEQNRVCAWIAVEREVVTKYTC